MVGIKIEERISLSQQTSITAGEIGDIYMVATSDTEAEITDLEATSIRAKRMTQSQFLAAYGDGTGSPIYSDLVMASLSAIFDNYPGAAVVLINGGKPAGEGFGDDAIPPSDEIADKLRLGLDYLGGLVDPPLGYLVVPEFINLENTEKGIIYGVADEVARAQRWIHTFQLDSPEESIPLEDLVTEREDYSSELGHSAAYIGYVPTIPLGGNEAIDVPLSVVATAIATKAIAEQGVAQPPAGVGYPIRVGAGVTDALGSDNNEVIKNYVLKDEEIQTLNNADINFVKQIPTVGFCLLGARTLAPSTTPAYRQLNTRQVMNSLTQRLRVALLPFIFSPVDPGGVTTEAVLLTATSIMEGSFTAGELSGRNSSEAYTITQTRNSANEIQIEIAARFVGTVEQIQVYLYAVPQNQELVV